MVIVFIDPSGWDYDPETPRHRPLGGTQSALCYLCESLAALGHDVYLVNGKTTPSRVRGVHCPGRAIPGEALRRARAVVLVGSAAPEVPRQLRPQCSPRTSFLVWSGHAYDQPAMAALKDPSARAAWDGLVCVSRWQAWTYAHTFDLDPSRIRVLLNAMSPAFENLFASGPILPHKPWPPVMAYTSTPFRGLDRLLDAVPLIRRQIPGTRLRVFSSLAVYNQDPLHDQYQNLYQRCAATEGVEYVGGVSQPELAQALKSVNLLAYPNIFPETSCIAAMEALAAGCLVVTSRLGALPETLAGMATLTPASIDRLTHVQEFAQAVVSLLAAWPPGEQTLAAQVAFAQSNYAWPARAAQWEEMLEGGCEETGGKSLFGAQKGFPPQTPLS